MAKRRPWIRDRSTALLIGYTGMIIGALALWDAYENRGRSRPFATKLLPGA